MKEKIKKLELICQAKELGWNIVMRENHAKYTNKTSNGTDIGLEFDFTDENDFVYQTDIYALDYWVKASHARDIRSTIENFTKNCMNKNFNTVNDLWEYLEKYHMTLRRDNLNDNIFFLAVNNGNPDYLYRFRITDELNDHTRKTEKTIQEIIDFIHKFNAESFAYMYLLKTKEQSQILKNIYKEADEASELYHKLFNVVDEIRFA